MLYPELLEKWSKSRPSLYFSESALYSKVSRLCADTKSTLHKARTRHVTTYGLLPGDKRQTSIFESAALAREGSPLRWRVSKARIDPRFARGFHAFTFVISSQHYTAASRLSEVENVNKNSKGQEEARHKLRSLNWTAVSLTNAECWSDSAK